MVYTISSHGTVFTHITQLCQSYGEDTSTPVIVGVSKVSMSVCTLWATSGAVTTSIEV
jgi:hypothetical protein